MDMFTMKKKGEDRQERMKGSAETSSSPRQTEERKQNHHHEFWSLHRFAAECPSVIKWLMFDSCLTQLTAVYRGGRG